MTKLIVFYKQCVIDSERRAEKMIDFAMILKSLRFSI
jgi:hypothetical protein